MRSFERKMYVKIALLNSEGYKRIAKYYKHNWKSDILE